MPSDAPEPFDVGLLSPLTAGVDERVSDAAILAAMIAAEVALTAAWEEVGEAPRGTADAVPHAVDASAVVAEARSGGNPVIPLVAALRAAATAHVRPWIHRGATSQDILDTALMIVSRDAAAAIADALGAVEAALRERADGPVVVGVARTLTQHAVPTTLNARFASWSAGVRRARARLAEACDRLPAQLGGAAGTLASFVELAGSDTARRLPSVFAAEAGLAEPDAPWHTTRWPVTELGDALVQSIDALGRIATDVAILVRPEIGELVVTDGGGSSAMPQKQNPVAAVLVRSAALRAPQLGATLHLAAALAGDERPDGAWHAEWPTLRELLRLALGAADRTLGLVVGLRVDEAAVARNLSLSGGLVLAERLGLVLRPLIGAQRFDELIAEASAGADLRALLQALPEAKGLDLDDLLDPANYTGLAGDRHSAEAAEDAT